MLNAKTMGHSIYSMKRRKEFIDNVLTLKDHYGYNPNMLFKKGVNKVTNVHENKNLKHRILGSVLNRDFNTLANELLFNLEFVLKVRSSADLAHLSYKSQEELSILHLVCKNGWYKGFKLVYSAILQVLTNDKHELSKFVKNMLNDVVSDKNSVSLWGMEGKDIIDGSTMYKIVEMLLQCKYLDNIVCSLHCIWCCGSCL